MHCKTTDITHYAVATCSNLGPRVVQYVHSCVVCFAIRNSNYFCS